jgi:diaminopimelate decarboxylase
VPTSRDASGRLTFTGAPALPFVELVESTPAYVYDLDAIAAEARELKAAFEGEEHLVAYAVKANSAGPVVRTLAAEGCGADVVSGAELAVALGAGVAPDAVVYSGVAKRDDELDAALAAGERGILAIQIESVEEIDRVAARARAARRCARVSIRVNPAVERHALDTHDHIATGHDEAKFGVPRGDVAAALDLVQLHASRGELALVGLGCHVGSQFTSTDGYVDAARTLFGLARSALSRGAFADLRFLDTGGGFGIDYGEGCPPRPADFIKAVRKERAAAGLDALALLVEPGRSLVGAHGVLLSRVIQTKTTLAGGVPRRWLMIDAGMNDLMRPALYQAHHRIVPLVIQPREAVAVTDVAWRVVGPVCESSDDFGLHPLPETAPDHVALLDAGAYGFTMASRYNGRPAPAEIFLRGGAVVARSAAGDARAWVEERLRIASA